MLDDTASIRGIQTESEFDPRKIEGKSKTLPRLNLAIDQALNGLLGLQHDQGYWHFELEADCTIPAEYIIMMHYMDEIDEVLQARICNYLRARQKKDGSYPLYTGGAGDISGSTKVYFALKLAGDNPEQAHMQKAREYILSVGGAAISNVFTRIMLATFEQIPWRGVPYSPVEIMLLPRWFPFHLQKISYWSRTVMVPLLILCTLKAKARNPKNIGIPELFVTPPELEQNYFPNRSRLNRFFVALDNFGRLVDPLIPKRVRQHAINKARDWFVERLNGEDGLGGIFPAMVNAYEAMDLLGFPKDDERLRTAKKALEKLLVIREHDAYCQPCLSPIWDTGLSILAIQECGTTRSDKPVQKGLEWLLSKQLTNEPGDWRDARPELAGGGWAFEFENPHYPDVDDSAAVAFALAQSEDPQYHDSLRKAANWIAGMQSKNGGFGAFDADNTRYYLNEIPFADHGALLDPPSADVSARCLMFLSMWDAQTYRPVIDRCLDYIESEQESDGSWFGRWGTNYIYGTWSVLAALEQAKFSAANPLVRRAVDWLKSVQRSDGGWGEDNFSYHDSSFRGNFDESTAAHTAWALLGLMAAGEAKSPEVVAGIQFLLHKQETDGFWRDKWFNAPGFPKVFYLRYHGYDKFFPLWALARYRNLTSGT